MTRVPITSPLAVLTTRTTQEHLMNTHSPAHLKPGDFVQHPEKGHGLVRRRFARYDVGVMYADLDRDGIDSFDLDLAGWERVETVRPGHVQVRVDDLAVDWSDWVKEDEDNWGFMGRTVIRVARAKAAQRAEATPPADEPETVGDGCECWVTPEHMWTTYGSAVEPGSQVEPNPRCPKHGEKPTGATVTLPCPDCGEEITNTAMVEVNREGERYLDFCNVNVHTCPPAQPDEPTEFGARITVTLPDGTREKWCRLGKHHSAPWLGETYDVPGEEWGLLCQRGTVTLGWDE